MGLKPDEPDLAALEAGVTRLIAEDDGPRGRVRAWPRLPRFALLAAIGALVVGGVFVFLRRPDFAAYPALRYYAVAGSAAAVGLVALWQALRPLHRPPLPAWLVRGTVIVGVLLPIVVALLPELPTHDPRHLGWSLACWGLGGVSGSLVLAPLLWLARDGLRELDRALFAAIAAGMAGLGVVHTECANNQPIHLLVAHAAVPLLFLAGMWLRRLRGG